MNSKIPVPVALGNRDRFPGIAGNSPSHKMGRDSPHSIVHHHPHHLNHRSPGHRPITTTCSNPEESQCARSPGSPTTRVTSPPKFEAFMMTGDLMINLARQQTSELVLTKQSKQDQIPFRKKNHNTNITNSSIQLGGFQRSQENKKTGNSLPNSPADQLKSQATFVRGDLNFEESRNKLNSNENSGVRLSRSENHLLQESLKTVEFEENLDDVNNQSSSLEMLMKSDNRSPEISMSSSSCSANSGRAVSISPTGSDMNECSSVVRSSRTGTTSRSDSVEAPSPCSSEPNGPELIPSVSSTSFSYSANASIPDHYNKVQPSFQMKNPNQGYSAINSNNSNQSSGNRTFSKSELQEIANAMSLSSSSSSSESTPNNDLPSVVTVSENSRRVISKSQQQSEVSPKQVSEKSTPEVDFFAENGPKRYPSFLVAPDDEADAESTPEDVFHMSESTEAASGALPRSVDVASASRLAKRLFDLQGFKKSDVSRHLSKNNEFSRVVAEEYLKLIDLKGDTLDAAIRKFISRFCLVGETQERERVLNHFSRRYHECNPSKFTSADSVHTLTCALMLLNTDLHGENVGRKMTVNEFIDNLSQMDEGKDFPADVLRSLYSSIKSCPLEWARDEIDGKMNGSKTNSNFLSLFGGGDANENRSSDPVNPFLEFPTNGANEFKKGYLVRKCCFDSNGKRTPLGKRSWKMFFATLRDLVLYLHKDEQGFRKNQMCESLNNSVRIHHALATKASDYTKKDFVFRLITADQSEYLFKASDAREQQSWVDAINLAAATLSSPPLAPAVGSHPSKFQRPLLPVSHSKFSLRDQLVDHESRIVRIEKDLENHLAKRPSRSATRRVLTEFEDKESYLQHELRRYRTYSTLLKMRLQQTLGAQVLDKVLQKSILTGGAVKSKPLTSLSIGEEVIKDSSDGETDLSDQDPVIEPARKRKPRANRSS